MKRYVAFAATGVTAFFALGCGSKPAAPPSQVPVTVAKVEKRAVPFEIGATGTVEPLQTVAVESQVGGILKRVTFKEGDDVQVGQVLFEIDPRTYQSALNQARAMLARDVAQLKSAQLDVQRYDALVQRDFVTAQQYDQVKTTATALASTVQGDSAAVENARLSLEFATIRAPISGRAGGLLVREGNLVRSSGPTPLVVINQIHPVLVRFAVPSANLPVIQQYRSSGLVVRVEVPNATGAPIEGTLSFLDNAVDTTTGTILLKGLFANGDGILWPGEFVNARLQLYVQSDALVIPAQSVVPGQQGAYVFVIGRDTTASTRPVTVSRTVGEIAVIGKGLTEGEVVVTDGQLKLTPGARVQIQPQPDSVPGGTKR